MSFTCYPIIVSRAGTKKFPSANSVIQDILDTGEIPIRLITDKKDLTFKEIQVQMKEIEIESGI